MHEAHLMFTPSLEGISEMDGAESRSATTRNGACGS
jgi:hypothetical protein